MIERFFIGQPHHRSSQAWHVFSRDHIVLPATHAFIHERIETYRHLSFPDLDIDALTKDRFDAVVRHGCVHISADKLHRTIKNKNALIAWQYRKTQLKIFP